MQVAVEMGGEGTRMKKKYYDSFAVMDAITEFMEKVGNIQGADVVEVVRCKDCKHSYDSVGGWCCSHGVCVDCIVPEDFFCKDGEHEEDEG